MSLAIDTHTHVFSPKFDDDREEVLARARECCSHLFLPNIDETTIDAMNAVAAAHPGFALPMMGVHPTHVRAEFKPQLQAVERELSRGGYWGVGETGLDRFWSDERFSAQQASLRRHADWARELELPLILHARGAFSETADIVEEFQDGRLRGIFHCFSEDAEAGRRAIDNGFLLGLGGVLTFNKSHVLREAVAQLPREAIVLETDSPYLAPQAKRGRRNEPSYVQYVAETLASVWGLSVAETLRITSENARRLFQLPVSAGTAG